MVSLEQAWAMSRTDTVVPHLAEALGPRFTARTSEQRSEQ